MNIEDNRKTLPASPQPGSPKESDSGPRKPDITKPNDENLLERMKRVEPDKARRYRQRSGE